MFREQMINFLEAAVVLLTLTNALSAVAAACAISIARDLSRPHPQRSGQSGFLSTLAQRLRIDH